MKPGIPPVLAYAADNPPRTRELTVQGRRARALEWGDPEGIPTLLLHGGGANAWWWCMVAPALAEGGHHAVAVDLAGHGQSDPATTYSFDDWATDAVAAAEHLWPDRAFAVVGHSLGGLVALVAAARASRADWELIGTIALDSRISSQAMVDARDPAERFSDQPHRPHASPQEAVRRFRLIPPQSPPDPAILEYIARRSMREVSGGWTWEFDPQVFARPRTDPERFATDVAGISSPVAVILGARSAVAPESEALLRPALPSGTPFVVLPRAEHHMVLDRAMPLAGCLTGILGVWATRRRIHPAV